MSRVVDFFRRVADCFDYGPADGRVAFCGSVPEMAVGVVLCAAAVFFGFWWSWRFVNRIAGNMERSRMQSEERKMAALRNIVADGLGVPSDHIGIDPDHSAHSAGYKVSNLTTGDLWAIRWYPPIGEVTLGGLETRIPAADADDIRKVFIP